MTRQRPADVVRLVVRPGFRIEDDEADLSGTGRSERSQHVREQHLGRSSNGLVALTGTGLQTGRLSRTVMRPRLYDITPR